MMMTESVANFSMCCRLCLADNVEFKSIFDNCADDQTLQQKISTLLGVVILTSDKLSTLVCNVCIEKITNWQSFKVSCTENQAKLFGNNNLSELTIQIKEEPIDCEGPSSVELVSGEIRVKNEIVEDELPPPLTPQNCTEPDPEEEEASATISQEVATVPVTVLEDPDPRMCITCEKRFSSANNRKKHEWRVHRIPRRRNTNAANTTASSSVTELDFNSSSQDERSQNSMLSNNRQADPEKRSRKREYTDISNIVSGKRKTSYKPPIIEPEIEDEDFLQESKVINPKTIQRIGGTVCPICNKNYSNNNNMFRHYKSHFDKKDKEDNLHACPDCKGMFNSVEWDKHKETHQNKNCNVCGKIFLFQSELDQHRSVHLNLKLSTDSKTQADKNQMVGLNPERSFMCETCDRMFTTKEQLKKHKLLHKAERAEEEGVELQQEKRYPCILCEKIYISRGGLWRHMRKMHPTHQAKLNEYPKKCPLCEKVLSNAGGFKLHSLMHLRNGTLQKDHQTGSAKEEDSDESYSTCKRCFKVFSNRTQLKKHMRCHGLISPMSGSRRTSQKKAWCDPCNCSFDSLAILEEHRNSFHGDLDDSMPQLRDEYGDDVKSLVFNTKSARKKHNKKHASDYQTTSLNNKRSKNVYCEICKIGLENEQILLKHMQDEHSPKQKKQQAQQEVTKSLKFKCDLCPKSFNRLISLHSHAGWHKRLDLSGENQTMLEPLIRIQEEPFDESFKCNTCGQVNANDTALQIHILERHRNVDALALSSRCNRCNVDFRSEGEYEKHKELHTMVEQQQQQRVKQKTFNCTQCPTAFNRLESLKLHIKQFHVVQEFRCLQCDRVFDKQNSFSIHLKVHEKQKLNSLSGGESAAKQPEVATAGAVAGKSHLFVCSICNKGFDVPKDLRVHTMKAHPF